MSTISDLLTEAASRTTPWKLEARLCSTVGLTLVGEQPVDGVGAEENDRVLLIGQTDEKQNGPWIVKRDAWVRPVDYNDPQSARIGTTIIVYNGTDNAGVYRLTAPNVGEVVPDQTDTTWDLVGAFSSGGGGGSYTAGDGLALAGSDFDVDLTDTTIFAPAAATASRVPVLDASAKLVAAGLTRTSGAIDISTVTSGGITIASGGSSPIEFTSAQALNAQAFTNLRLGVSATSGSVWLGASGDGLTQTPTLVQIGSLPSSGTHAVNLHGRAVGIRSSAPLTLEGGDSYLLKFTRPSIDVRPPPSHEIVGRATSLASGSTTAANKIGPHKVTELGRGQTIGTDAPGSWFVGIGDAVSNVVSGGVIFGSGAASGTPGNDAYRPYTTELLRIRQSTATAALIEATTDLAITSAQNTTITPANNGSLLPANNLTLRGGNVTEVQGNILRLYGTNRKIEIGNSSVDSIYVEYFVDTAIASATTTTCATFTPVARPRTYRIVVHLYDASGNAATWVVDVAALLSGGVAVLSGSPPTGAAPTRSIGTPSGSPTLTIDASTTTIRVRITTTTATAVTAVVCVPTEVL